MSFSLPNPYSTIRTITRKDEALIESLEQEVFKAREHNNSINNSKPLGKLKRFCPLDETPLKAIKPKPVEGLPEISKPRYRCVMCKSVFEGFGLDLYHESRKSVKAIVFPYDGTI